MLSEKTKADLAKSAGLTVSELASAISDEKEKDLDIKVTKSFTDKEWETHETSIEDEKDGLGKDKYDEGKEVGERQVIRDMKAKAGLEYEGKKPEDFINKYKASILEEADKNPDKRIIELQKDKDALNTTIGERDTKIKELGGKITMGKIDGRVKGYLPEKYKDGMNEKDAFIITKANLEYLTDEDGNEYAKRNGSVLKDNMRKNISWETATTDFVIEKGWGANKSGRGGGGGGLSDTKNARKMSELNEYFEKNNINPLGQEAKAMIVEAEKSAKEAKEEFVFD